MVELLGKETFKVQVVTGRMIVITEILASDHDHGRVLHMECGNMFDVQNIEIADIVMLETDIPGHLQPELCELLQNMHDGARTLTYLDLRRIWTAGAGLFGFRQMDCNRWVGGWVGGAVMLPSSIFQFCVQIRNSRPHAHNLSVVNMNHFDHLY